MSEGVLSAAVPWRDDATAAARAAADRAGVVIRQLHDLESMQQVVDLFVDVWQTRKMDPPVNRDLLRALSHAGGYIAAAEAGGAIVGASVGLFAADGTLHSHISGVRSGFQGRSVGFALKLDQRAWCLARGIPVITWTFDPLVRRNAWFNLGKLGVTCEEYLPDFYGSMRDGVNAGDSSDRLFARWDLRSDRVVEAVAGAGAGVPLPLDGLGAPGTHVVVEEVDGRPTLREPAPAPRATLLVGTPFDVIALREEDRELAGEWRETVRAGLTPAFTDGYHVTGMTRTGYYVLTSKDAHHS